MMGLPPSERDNDMCQAATTKIQAIFRAAMQRRTVSEAAATVAIVVTEGFGDLIGRNDIRHVLNDLQMQKRRLEEKIENLEQSMYYAKATRQKEIRNVTKLGRKKVREIEEQIKLLKEPKAPGGGDLDFSGLERQAWQMQAMNKERAAAEPAGDQSGSPPSRRKLVDRADAMVFWNTISSFWTDLLPSEVDRRLDPDNVPPPPPPRVVLRLRVQGVQGHQLGAPGATGSFVINEVPFRVSLSRPGSAARGATPAVAALGATQAAAEPTGNAQAPAAVSTGSLCVTASLTVQPATSTVDERRDAMASRLSSSRLSSRLQTAIQTVSRLQTPRSPSGLPRSGEGSRHGERGDGSRGAQHGALVTGSTSQAIPAARGVDARGDASEEGAQVEAPVGAPAFVRRAVLDLEEERGVLLAEQKRELEDELVVDVKQRYEDGATKRRQQVDGVSGSRRKTRVRGDTLDEVEGGVLRVLEEELLEEERSQGIAKVYDSLDADASNRSLDAVRATYVHAVMNTGDHGQMQHHLARSLLLDIRLPWYQVCAADVRVAKNLLAKVMLQRKMALAVAHSLRMGKEQGSRRKQASNAEKLEALMHYAAMLDYMKDLLAGKLRKMRFALIRRAIRACVERRREDLSRPECIRAATSIQKYYRTYRVRRLLDLCAALQQQDRDLKARLEHQRQVRQRLGKGFQRMLRACKCSPRRLAPFSTGAPAAREGLSTERVHDADHRYLQVRMRDHDPATDEIHMGDAGDRGRGGQAARNVAAHPAAVPLQPRAHAQTAAAAAPRGARRGLHGGARGPPARGQGETQARPRPGERRIDGGWSGERLRDGGWSGKRLRRYG